MGGKIATTRVLDFLHSYPDRKFYLYEISNALFLPRSTTSKILCSVLPQRGIRICKDECRDAAFPQGRIRYWLAPQSISAQRPQEKTRSAVERRLCKWFLDHPRAARPSVISASVKIDIETVAEQLDKLYVLGDMQRCELPLRQGADRYEYRLVGVGGAL